jgi:hypothetical protein
MINPSKILFLIISLFLNACMREPDINYIISNKSKYPLEINFYSKGKLQEGLFIKPSKSFSRTAGVNDGFIINIKVDSIEIIFDSKRKILHYCNGKSLYESFPNCNPEKNFIDFRKTPQDKKRVFFIRASRTITFDNTDYEKAIPF